MNGKPMIMLLFAVVSGLGAMYGTTKLLARKSDAPVVEMQDVVVAARDIKIEEPLNKADMLKVVRKDKTSVPPGSFSQIKDVEDRWVQMSVLEDEPIIERKLAPKGTPLGVVARIPKGMRAFAVEVNEQSGVAGWILPDHRVDVIEIQPGAQGQSEAETVLQDVLVLAAGQTITRPDERSVQARTVTLAVTEEQAEVLVAAKARGGSLSLSLRPLDDHEQVARKKKVRPEPKPEAVVKAPEPMPALPAPAPAPPAMPAPVAPAAPSTAPRPATPRYIVIYRGTQRPERVRIDQPEDASPESMAASGPQN